MKYSIKRIKKILSLTLVSSCPLPPSLRTRLVVWGGVKCDDRNSLFIGNKVTIDTLYPEKIHIGEKVHITTGVIILTHGLDTTQKGTCWFSYQVDIESGSFIGANSIICGNVKIGENAIVGAGSIVTKDIPSNEIWAGNPARFIKKREFDE